MTRRCKACGKDLGTHTIEQLMRCLEITRRDQRANTNSWFLIAGLYIAVLVGCLLFTLTNNIATSVFSFLFIYIPWILAYSLVNLYEEDGSDE